MTACWVKVRCVYGNMQACPRVSVIIQFWGQNDSVEAAVRPELIHSLIMGTYWPGIKVLVKHTFVDGSCHSEVWGEASAALAGEVVLGLSTSALNQGTQRMGRALTHQPFAGIPLGVSIWSSHMMRH